MPVTFSLDDRIEQLLQYQTEYGHMFVPLKYKPNNLGSWVNNKKAAKKKNKLDRETVERLEEIGKLLFMQLLLFLLFTQIYQVFEL